MKKRWIVKYNTNSSFFKFIMKNCKINGIIRNDKTRKEYIAIVWVIL